MAQQYLIYEGFMEELRKKLVRIQNKCEKYGCSFTFKDVGEEYKEVVDTTITDMFGNHPTYNLRFVKIEAEGKAIINDWEFVASVEHTPKGNLFSKALIDIEIPEKYRCSSPYCEHCNTNRTRKNTCIIRNVKTNEFKQIGNSCLRDYTFGMDASFAALVASLRDIFEEYEEKDTSGFGLGFHEKYYDVKEVLQYAAETIRHFGYRKSSEPDSTKGKMMDIFNVLNGNTMFMTRDYVRSVERDIENTGFNKDSEEAVIEAESALKWLDEQKDNESNDYIHNLKVIVALEKVALNRFGILISLIPAYHKDMERQAKIKAEQETEKISEYVGTVGQRIEVTVNSIKCVTSWDSDYGTVYIWKIVDTDGNVFTWKTSNCISEDCKKIKGTVKEHKLYRDVKQTELTRCKVA